MVLFHNSHGIIGEGKSDDNSTSCLCDGEQTESWILRGGEEEKGEQRT